MRICGRPLTGEALANTLIGGAGNDTLRGMAGADVLDGGIGVDTAFYVEKTTAVVVTLNGAANATVLVRERAPSFSEPVYCGVLVHRFPIAAAQHFTVVMRGVARSCRRSSESDCCFSPYRRIYRGQMVVTPEIPSAPRLRCD